MAKLNVRKAAVAAALVLGAQALVAAPAFAVESGFTGTWTSVDTDGSNQVMTISGASAHTRAVMLFDDAGTICGGAPTLVSGVGTIDENILWVDVTVKCLPGGNPIHARVGIAFVYDEASDTIGEPSGVVWHRV